MIYKELLYCLLFSTIYIHVLGENGKEKTSDMETRVGYENANISSVTVYTGDTKPTGQTSPSTGSGSSSTGTTSGSGTGGNQGNPSSQKPTRPKPGSGRPWKPSFDSGPFTNLWGQRPQMGLGGSSGFWPQNVMSMVPSNIFSSLNDYEDDKQTMQDLLSMLNSFADY